jgi:CHAT domain-containing protein/Tfp pilus assembly protein PilF
MTDPLIPPTSGTIPVRSQDALQVKQDLSLFPLLFNRLSESRKLRLGFGLVAFLLASTLGQPAIAQEARWKGLSTQVRQLNRDGKYSEALPLALEAVRVAWATFGPDSLNMGLSVGSLGQVYWHLGKFADAEPLLEKAITIYTKARGPDHPDVASALSSLGDLYDNEGKYAEAEPLYRRALAIDAKALGSDDPEVAEDMNNLASVLQEQYKFAEAEELYRHALAIDERALGPEDARVSINLDNLASLLMDEARYPEAERLYRRAIAINEKAFGPDDPKVVAALNNIALLYEHEGKYAEAEPLFRRSLAISEKGLGPGDPDVATSLNNLASLYQDQGKYADAELLYRRALAIREKALGAEHPDVATTLSNLASLYVEQEKYTEAVPLDRRALAIREAALGPDHPDVAQSLSNLAALASYMDLYAEAEPLQRRAIAVLEKGLGPDHPSVATALNNLASLCQQQKKYSEAEPLYLRALKIDKNVLGTAHPDVATDLNNLAVLYDVQGRFAEARQAYDMSLEILANQFEYNFAYMSEKERLRFLATLAYRFELYFSFAFRQVERNPGLAGKMYDVLLWKKGVVASSAAAMQAKILASGDKDGLRIFGELTAKKTQLARLAFASEETDGQKLAARRARVEQLEREANELESELARRSALLGEEKRLARANWQQVRDTLQADEAAVEVASFPFADAGGNWTGTSYYVALVLRRESRLPDFVVLGKAEDLEAAPMEDYRGWVRRTAAENSRGIGVHLETKETKSASSGKRLVSAFWQPLEPYMKGAKRVYLAPDGVLNKVSLGVMPREDGRPLMEACDLRTVNSTKDLLRRAAPPSMKTATLFGNPDFEVSEAEQRAVLRSGTIDEATLGTRQLAIAEPNQRSRGLGGGELAALPGTQAEVDTLKSLLAQRGWNVEEYTQAQALEGRVKQVRSPRVLHIATHGFFLEDKISTPNKRVGTDEGQHVMSEDPMLRSGLFLAGADHVLNGSASATDLDDGVLSSYEVTQLNLQGTELVVLSACETGLGETLNGEGVFGLRRALQEAGAGSVLMSMWSVPDQETRELMELFYTHWLNGEEKHAALRSAELEEREQVKKRYGRDLPYYWGAFKLVGQ